MELPIIIKDISHGMEMGFNKASFHILTNLKIGDSGQIFKFDTFIKLELMVIKSYEISNMFLTLIKRIDSRLPVKNKYLMEGTRIINNYPRILSIKYFEENL